MRALVAARRLGAAGAMPLVVLFAMIPAYATVSATLFFPFHFFVFTIALGALIGRDVHLARPPETEFEAEVDWMWVEVEAA